MKNELRLSINFKRDDPQQVLMYQYLKEMKNGQRAVKVTRYMPLGILAHQDMQMKQNLHDAVEVPAQPKAAQAPPVTEETAPALPFIPTPAPAQPAAELEERQPVQAEGEPTEDDLLLLEQLKGFSQFYGGSG